MLYICLFFPASISIIVNEKLNKAKKDIHDTLVSYFSYTFFINLIVNIIYHFIYTKKLNWYSTELFTFDFAIQYMLISMAVAILLGCLVFIISKVVQINILVKERNKNAKKDTKNFSENYKRKH